MSLNFSELEQLYIENFNMHDLSISTFNNLVPLSINSDGTIYQNCGWIDNYRLNSAGDIQTSGGIGSVVTGFMPYSSSSLIHIVNGEWLVNTGYSYVMFYNAQFEQLGYVNCTPMTSSSTGYQSVCGGIVKLKNTSGTASDIIPSKQNDHYIIDHITFTSTADIAYFRVSVQGIGRKLIVSQDDEISFTEIWKSPYYLNWVPVSTENDGNTIYNNGAGFIEGYRISSSGKLKPQAGAVASGFIPANRGDVIRMSGAVWGTDVNEGYSYIQYYDSSFKVIGSVNKYEQSTNNNNMSNVSGNLGIVKSNSSIITDSNGVTTFNIAFNTLHNFSYFRISATGLGKNFIITVNEEII